jgi:uncharacterized protein involved in response to NO
MPRSLVIQGSMPEPVGRPRLAIAAKGFRPFFLLAAAFGVATVGFWILMFAGVATPPAYLDPFNWHAHEMVYGFTAAVIAGFLLTAVGNWSERETLVGAPLLALGGLWVAARVAMAAPGLFPRGVPAILDLSFLPLLMAALGKPLIAARNRRNFVMLAIVAALFLANVVIHLDALGIVAPGSARSASFFAIDVVLLMIVVIAGRIFPMFTRNATGVASIRTIPLLDRLSVAGMASIALLDALALDVRVVGTACAVTALVAAARAVHWGAQHSFRQPLLWVLHAGYAWVVIGLLLRGAAAWTSAVPASAAIHALTVGAIGTLTLGMMARVSLGHTGRMLTVGPAMHAAFVAVTIAAALRVAVPILVPEAYLPGLVVTGALWALAFGIYVVVHAPILVRPRADGKAG